MNDVDIKWIKNKEEALQYYMNKNRNTGLEVVLSYMVLNIVCAPLLFNMFINLSNPKVPIIGAMILTYLIAMLLHLGLIELRNQYQFKRKEDFSYYNYLKNKNKPKKQFKLI